MLCAGAPNLPGGLGARGAARLRRHECALSAAHPAARSLPGEEGGRGPRQEALGVDRACGNDFIGKACDIFSLLCVVLGGGWRCI